MAKNGKNTDPAFHAKIAPEFNQLAGELFGTSHFGQKPKAKPRLEFLEPVPCGSCGQVFISVAGRGRPQKFCSDPCRVAHRLYQQKSWGARTASAQPELCEGCGKSFPVRQVSAGRFRRFCSQNCRVASGRAVLRATTNIQQIGFSGDGFPHPLLPSQKNSHSLCALSGDLVDDLSTPAILPNGKADG